MRNVVAGLEPLRTRRTPPPFVQGQVPPYVSPLGAVSLAAYLIVWVYCAVVIAERLDGRKLPDWGAGLVGLLLGWAWPILVAAEAVAWVARRRR